MADPPQDPVARLNAALEGRYHIERELGQGGMATVYLAEDLRHERNVALKVLKPELAAVVGAERFLAEIKTTANLQHPHILPLFDSGEAGGASDGGRFLFYVMPYVEGDTLSDKIDREKQLGIEEAVKITEKVASALDHAHKHGVVHRDIKPGNILLSAEGEPTVADFGIALAVAQAGGGRVTETGLSVGTPHYMSPEQATGDRDVDPRTDVYALGCVLYEMLIGEPPYTGSTAQAVLAKILTDPAPAPMRVRVSVPPNVDAAIGKALEKLPADRFAGVSDFARALSDPSFRHGGMGEASAAEPRGRWKPLALASTALALLLALGWGWSLTRPGSERPVARFAAPFQPGQAPAMFISEPAFTPDGSALVYSGPNASGEPGIQLWIRRWADLEATPLRGTESTDLRNAFALSPDGRDIAFPSDDGSLRVMSLDGGPARTLVGSSVDEVSHWGLDGMVYFSGEGFDLRRVPSQGGGPEAIEALTAPDVANGEFAHSNLTLLPGGGMGVFQVLRTLTGGDAQVWAIDVETRETKFLTAGGNPRVSSSGHLFFTTFDGTLWAVPIDPETAELSGTPVPVLDDLFLDPVVGRAAYAISADGALFYRAGLGDVRASEGVYQPIWVTRSGEVTPVDPGWRIQLTFAGMSPGISLSPDAGRIAVTHEVEGNSDIWIKQLPDGPFERLTVDDEPESAPQWSANGQFIFYVKAGDGLDFDLWRRRADGAGAPELILDDARSLSQFQQSPDGAWVVMRAGPHGVQANRSPERDIIGFRLGVDSAAVPLIASAEFVEQDPALSPDGRWLAYISDLSGRDEVYVSPFPEVDSGRVRVSTAGGDNPTWAPNGAELFFVDESEAVVSVQVEAGSEFRVIQRTTLFSVDNLVAGAGLDLWDISPDGTRFLMIQAGGNTAALTDPEAPSRFILVQNWFEELRELLGER